MASGVVKQEKPLKREGGGEALSESPGCWNPGSRQAAGWAAEGVGKGET